MIESVPWEGVPHVQTLVTSVQTWQTNVDRIAEQQLDKQGQ